MKVDSIQDSTRYVVSEVHKGSIIPGNRAEMWRSIYLDKGANIIGGIWGGEMQISGGNVNISDSIYIRGAINIFNESKKKLKIDEIIEFNSVVSTPESLSIESNAPRTRFNSDLYVGQLVLKNAVVYGNIYASNARLENCIVLGGIYCKKKLELTNTIVFVFKTKSLKLNHNIYMLSPYSISEEEFDIEYPVKALTFFDLLDNNSTGGTISLDENDIFKVKYSEHEAEDDSEDNLPSKVYILSIVERILNSSSIIEQFRKNKDLIEFLAFGNNLLEEFNEKFKDFTKNDLEESLWKLVDEGISSTDINGSDNFNNLLKTLNSDGISAFKRINSYEEKNKPQKDILDENPLINGNTEVKNNSDHKTHKIKTEPDDNNDVEGNLTKPDSENSKIHEDIKTNEIILKTTYDEENSIINTESKKTDLNDNDDFVLNHNDTEVKVDEITTNNQTSDGEISKLNTPAPEKTEKIELEQDYKKTSTIIETPKHEEFSESNNMKIKSVVTPTDTSEHDDSKELKDRSTIDSNQEQIVVNDKNGDLIYCQECGESNDINLKFCISCGSELQIPKEENVSTIECSSCGHKYINEFAFCPECGFKN